MSHIQPIPLTYEETIILSWQYRKYDGFYKMLMELISIADEVNLQQLQKGFPYHISGYRRYISEQGWWPMVQNKARNLGWEV